MAAERPDLIPLGSPSLSGPSEGHSGCRMEEFVRWNRIMLEHERAHLSRVMRGKAFLRQQDIDEIMHDLADIDAVLAQHPRRVEVESPK